MQRPFGMLIWPRIATCWRSYSGILRGLLKGITVQHPVCPRSCMILAGVTLKTAGGTLDWLCSTRLSLGIWPLMQIRLVWWLRTTGQEQIIDTNSGQYGHLRLGCATHLLSEQSVIGTQLPAVVVEQENTAAFKAQLARCTPVCMP